MENELTADDIKSLIVKTEIALDSIEVTDEKANPVLDMCRRYVSDSRHFTENGDLRSALGAIEYAHGLIDACVGAGLVKVLENDELFVF